MNIHSFSRDKIKAVLDRTHPNSKKEKRILFSPQIITEQNLNTVCNAYSHIDFTDIKTVVIVESCPGEAEKKLVMPSFKIFQNHLGKVKADEKLRNDFADEDDDFFIIDKAIDEQSGLYQQLPMLQSVLDEFTVLHIQIMDERLPILKELAMALQEILPSRNALLVCCCDLGGQDEVDPLTDLLDDGNFSGLMNRLNREESNIGGAGAFVAGLLVSKKWGLKIDFQQDVESGAVQSACAVVQNQPVSG